MILFHPKMTSADRFGNALGPGGQAGDILERNLNFKTHCRKDPDMADGATTASNFDLLESYFRKYPDAPKETIVKQHLLSLGHWFSDAALAAAAGALVK